ncbi:MAG TPA: hypothetical protein VIX73_24200, partial [Kofleriaceae bacterium]
MVEHGHADASQDARGGRRVAGGARAGARDNGGDVVEAMAGELEPGELTRASADAAADAAHQR